jgi:hypothetical protein
MSNITALAWLLAMSDAQLGDMRTLAGCTGEAPPQADERQRHDAEGDGAPCRHLSRHPAAIQQIIRRARQSRASLTHP